MMNNENITLWQGDCLELMKDIPDGSIDAIVADPPYKYLKNQKLETEWDEDAVFEQWNRILSEKGFIVIFGRGESFYRWNTKLINMGFNFKEEVIWNKRYTSSPMTPVLRVHETVSILTKKGKVNRSKIPYLESNQFDLYKIQNDLGVIRSALNKHEKFERIWSFLQTNNLNYADGDYHPNGFSTTIANIKDAPRYLVTTKSIITGKYEQSIMEVKRDGRKTIVHPTQKPVRLMERLISLVSDEGSAVLDPFMGSGSTGVAAINTGRNFIGMELDEEYFEIAKNRILETNEED